MNKQTEKKIMAELEAKEKLKKENERKRAEIEAKIEAAQAAADIALLADDEAEYHRAMDSIKFYSAQGDRYENAAGMMTANEFESYQGEIIADVKGTFISKSREILALIEKAYDISKDFEPMADEANGLIERLAKVTERRVYAENANWLRPPGIKNALNTAAGILRNHISANEKKI